MAGWFCRDCTAAYAVDAPVCPQCGATDPIKEDEQIMPKITVHGGATNAATDEPDNTVADTVETEADTDAQPSETPEPDAGDAAEHAKRPPAKRRS